MSRHNYTNPAFCQQSEFYITPEKTNTTYKNGEGVRIHRSESTRSFQSAVRKVNSLNKRQQNHQQYNEFPPKPGPKPNISHNDQYENRFESGRYASVPVEEIPNNNKSQYAVIPGPDHKIVQRFTKSQDNIDRYSHVPVRDDPTSCQEELNSFTSLPPILTNEDQPHLKSEFSSDFGSKSFVLVNQKNNQGYAVVSTAEDEEIVDDNHEIIQMENGRAHRYAIIPTDEQETCLSSSDMSPVGHNYADIQDSSKRPPFQTSTPQKHINYTQISELGTPIINPTQKLHEILSTPRTTPVQKRSDSIRNSSRRYQQVLASSSKPEFTPQRLQCEAKQVYLEARTTAVIIPMVAQSLPNEDGELCMNKTWNNERFKKVANATATIGAVSLMLILGGAMNSGLCFYMISNMGRSYYLNIGVISGFAAIGLGILGFKSRYCDWLPNRNYISGFILVTVFSLLKCCGLLILLVMHPFPGTPLHDVTTGVVLGFSSLTLLLISLEFVTSTWCKAPPPDNRVDIY